MGRAVTILIVESEESGRRSTERLMKTHGFRTLVFTNGSHLLATSGLDTTCCVLVDDAASSEAMLLPHALSARGTPFPVILLTESDSEGLRARARKAGIAACFLKPVDDQALMDAIDWALSAPPSAWVLAGTSEGGRP